MIEHPTYPLQHEQRAEIIAEARTQADVQRIQREFAKRRDVEFPGWADRYQAEIKEWLASNSGRRRA